MVSDSGWTRNRVQTVKMDENCQGSKLEKGPPYWTD